MCLEVSKEMEYLDSLRNKINAGVSLTMQQTLDAVDAGLLDSKGDTMVTKRDEGGTIRSNKERNVKRELNGLKLNVRISPNSTAKNVLDVNLYNHSKHIHYTKISNEGMNTDIFEMYNQQYELSLYSQSRINAQHQRTKLTDDFDICIQGFDPKRNATFGEFFQLKDITYVDDAVISGGDGVDNRTDAETIGVIGKWTFCKTKDETEYFFRKGKKFITGTCMQTAVEKYALSTANTDALTIQKVKEVLNIADVKFYNDLSRLEAQEAEEQRQEKVRKEIAKLANATTKEHEDYVFDVALVAMSELSLDQRNELLQLLEAETEEV